MLIKRKEGKIDTPVKAVAPVTKVSLPDSVSTPSDKLGDYSILLYGEKKIGKTSLASKFPNAFFLMFEPGAKALSVYQKPVDNWSEFRQYVKLLKEDNRFATVVIDPIDLAYKACVTYICQKLVIQHPSDEEWGKGWEAIRDEFTSQINELLSLNKGVIFISHATEKEIKTRTGDKYHKISPTMAGQARDVLEGIVDIWVYYSYNGKERVLYLTGDEHIGAGHRLENHFKYTNGSPIQVVSMGKSPAEAYKNFMEAFENRTKTNDETETKPKMTIKRRK